MAVSVNLTVKDKTERWRLWHEGRSHHDIARILTLRRFQSSSFSSAMAASSLLYEHDRSGTCRQRIERRSREL